MSSSRVSHNIKVVKSFSNKSGGSVTATALLEKDSFWINKKKGKNPQVDFSKMLIQGNLFTPVDLIEYNSLVKQVSYGELDWADENFLFWEAFLTIYDMGGVKVSFTDNDRFSHANSKKILDKLKDFGLVWSGVDSGIPWYSLTKKGKVFAMIHEVLFGFSVLDDLQLNKSDNGIVINNWDEGVLLRRDRSNLHNEDTVSKNHLYGSNVIFSIDFDRNRKSELPVGAPYSILLIDQPKIPSNGLAKRIKEMPVKLLPAKNNTKKLKDFIQKINESDVILTPKVVNSQEGYRSIFTAKVGDDHVITKASTYDLMDVWHHYGKEGLEYRINSSDILKANEIADSGDMGAYNNTFTKQETVKSSMGVYKENRLIACLETEVSSERYVKGYNKISRNNLDAIILLSSLGILK